MRIGLIAPEYSTAAGGMSEYARQLSTSLARTDIVTIYARRDAVVPESQVRTHRVLAGELAEDGRALSGERQDVWFALNAGYVALARRLRAPLLAYFNGNDFLNPWVRRRRRWPRTLARRRGLWRFAPGLEKSAIRRDMRRGMHAAAALVANSTNSASLISRLYPGFEDRLVVIPPGVADDFFQEHKPLRAVGAPLELLTVSRLERWTRRKNIDGVLHALKLLPRSLGIHYTVVGDGDDRPRLESILRELQLGDRAEFVGSVPRERLRHLYRSADLFIMASRSRELDVEGFGIVYLEASAAGTPAICSRGGGACDAVEDGVNGIVIDESTPEAIASVIERFAAARELFPPGRVRSVAERYRWTAIAGRVRAVLDAAMRSGR